MRISHGGLFVFVALLMREGRVELKEIGGNSKERSQ
jgi:hypothetical protein